jgi:aryl-alcohol dehydrogenase-like predicted oxidoreductase
VGYRHLDCASLYNNQEIVGKGIADWIASDPSKNKREDLYITSKVCSLAGRTQKPGNKNQFLCHPHRERYQETLQQRYRRCAGQIFPLSGLFLCDYRAMPIKKIFD